MPADAYYQPRLAMVYRRLDGRATLEPIDSSSSETGQEVFERIKKQYHQLARRENRLWCFALLLTRLEVGVAEIRWALTDFTRTEISGTRVELGDFERYNLFSEGIRHPALLANESDFLMKYGSLALIAADATYPYAGQQLLVVYSTADKEKIAWLLLLALILSPALGLIV
ncbi:MAG: hypothetical protein Q9204_006006, partial [Flavoplaca sp. TL-2023a]